MMRADSVARGDVSVGSTTTTRRIFSSLGLPSWLFAVDDVMNGRPAGWSPSFTRTPDDGSIPWSRVDHSTGRLGHLRRVPVDGADHARDAAAPAVDVNERLPFPPAQLGRC